MMAEGWIALHRQIREHQFWKEKPFTRAQAWIDILLTVNWKDERVLIGNELIPCSRGQSVRSLDTWAKRWGWNKSAVRRFFKLLQNDHMIVTENVTKTTRLTVCNYDSYQDVRHDNETIVKRLRNDDETIVTPKNNENKENNENKKEENTGADAFAPLPDAPPVILIPTNVKGKEYPITETQRDEYAELYPGVDVDAELRKMRAWSVSNPTKRKTARGMLAFVNNWLNKAQNESTRNTATKKQAGRNGRTYSPDAAQYEQLAREFGIGDAGQDEGAGAVGDGAVRALRGGERETD